MSSSTTSKADFEPGIHLLAEPVRFDERTGCAVCFNTFVLFRFALVVDDKAGPVCQRCARKHGFSFQRVYFDESA
jgi:hypothetical protein